MHIGPTMRQLLMRAGEQSPLLAETDQHYLSCLRLTDKGLMERDFSAPGSRRFAVSEAGRRYLGEAA